MRKLAALLLCIALVLMGGVLALEIEDYMNESDSQNQTTIIITQTEKPITITTNKEYTHNIYKINISADCLQNDSVGNNWYSEFRIDGQSIYDGQKISVPVDIKELKINARITEKDEYSDTEETTINLDLTKTEPTTVQLTVTESSGAYRGHTALWEITVSAVLVEKE